MKDARRLYKSYDQMVENLTNKEFQVCDARSPAMYSGEGKLCFKLISLTFSSVNDVLNLIISPHMKVALNGMCNAENR